MSNPSNAVADSNSIQVGTEPNPSNVVADSSSIHAVAEQIEVQTSSREVALQSATKVSQTVSQKKRSRQCFHYMRGHCKFGDKCRFIHDNDSAEKVSVKECLDYKKGYCRFGDNCLYEHNDQNNIPHFFQNRNVITSKPTEQEKNMDPTKNFQGMEMDIACHLQKALVGALENILINIKKC